MLRLSRSVKSTEHDQRLSHALEQRAQAEQALAEASLAKKELEARVAELEGAPAAREYASRGRALDAIRSHDDIARHHRDIRHAVVVPLGHQAKADDLDDLETVGNCAEHQAEAGLALAPPHRQREPL